ncbi:conserved domain protein [Enterococcus faecalis TX1467]|nr:conserved domain protein [Enterococcus faecalis TX1467]
MKIAKPDYASFRFANFNLVHFNQTRLVESEFFEVTWKKLLLEACDLTESNWLNTSLKGLDFSQNTFERLTFSPNYLSGLKVTPEQAIYLASALGLVIT